MLGRPQTRDKGLRCLLMYPSRCWLPGSPSIPQSLPVTGHSWLAYPALYPEFSNPGAGIPFPQLLFPYIIQTFGPRGPFGLLAPGSLPHPISSRLGSRPCSLWTLPDASGCFLLYIYYKPSPLPQLGAVTSSFLSLSLSLFHSVLSQDLHQFCWRPGV